MITAQPKREKWVYAPSYHELTSDLGKFPVWVSGQIVEIT